MVIREADYYNDNAVRQPLKQKPEVDKRKYEELEKARRNRIKRKVEAEKKKRKGIMQIAAAIFIIGILSISRDSQVYKMQKQLNHVQNQVKEAEDENEALKIEVMKNKSIQNIVSQANERLGMRIATKDDMVTIDLSNNYFAELD